MPDPSKVIVAMHMGATGSRSPDLGAPLVVPAVGQLDECTKAITSTRMTGLLRKRTLQEPVRYNHGKVKEVSLGDGEKREE